jgi:hypothetical protein
MKENMKVWSQWSVAEHLDAAQELFAKAPLTANGLHRDLIEANAHVNAALALATKRSGGVT